MHAGLVYAPDSQVRSVVIQYACITSNCACGQVGLPNFSTDNGVLVYYVCIIIMTYYHLQRAIAQLPSLLYRSLIKLLVHA